MSKLIKEVVVILIQGILLGTLVSGIILSFVLAFCYLIK